MFDNDAISYLVIDENWRDRIAHDWGEKSARHMHFSNGFTISATCQNKMVGLISTYWRNLPPPLSETIEGYIDFLEVCPAFRRRGIARQLIEISIQRIRDRQAYQVRSWSSEDKVEALPMWKRIGFGLCPATTYPRGQEVHGFFVSLVLG